MDVVRRDRFRTRPAQPLASHGQAPGVLDTHLSTHTRTMTERRASLAADLERLPHHPRDVRPLRVGWGGQRDESRFLSPALEESTVVVELPTSVKDQARMSRKGADPNDI